MLVSIYYPFFDFRPLLIENFSRLENPSWPFPSGARGHVRGIGSVRRRPKRGFEGWVGEDRLAIGVSAIALKLPRHDCSSGLARLRLIRKACYFDGLLNGRIEFLFSIEGSDLNRSSVLSIVDRALSVTSTVRRNKFRGPLSALPSTVALLWATSTVKHGTNDYSSFVKSAPPICVVESEAPLWSNQQATRPSAFPRMDLTKLSNHGDSDILLIWPSDLDIIGHKMGLTHIGKGSEFRAHSRILRTYFMRLLQDIQGLSMLFKTQDNNITSDRIQNLLNEYTRQINRSRIKIENYENRDAINYCYSVFSKIYPGRIEAIRIQIQASNIRPNIAKKIISVLDMSESAAISIAGNLVMEEIMGDKFEDINVSGQGVAIGRGAKADVTQSSNTVGAQESLSSALSALAESIRAQKHKEDAQVEAAIVDAAAKKAGDGDETAAAALIKKCAAWVLDLMKSTSSAVIVAFLKTHFGL